MKSLAIRVGIVEDNPEFLARFSNLVTSCPDLFLVGTASTAADAIALINRCPADVFLIDLGLPDMDGTEVIKHAVKTHPNSDSMVITVFGDKERVMASIEAGATGYLLKGSSQIEIADSIRTLRNGGSPISSVIAKKILQRLRANRSQTAEPASPTAANSSQMLQEALTERETKILQSIGKGLSNKEIADSFCVSAATVAWHVKKIYRKLAVRSRGEAVHEAAKMGLLNS